MSKPISHNLTIENNLNLVINLQIPDIGAELTNGCRGFSTKFMHWPKNLIMGGISHNKTGYVNK